jgi:tetratricopeptide (TPR) repeat protein
MKDKTRIIFPAALFLTVFFIYLRTLNPVFHANDSPETAACAYTLGIQHPPGYPLAALLGKIFTFIPAGNTGFRVNMQAGFFGALAAMMLFLLMLDMLKGKSADAAAYIISASTALCFAASPTIWPESLSSKGGIYSLNAFLMLFTVYSLFTWERTKRIKWLYTAAFAYGMSLSNHWESMAAATPALLIFAFLILRKDGLYKTIKMRHAAFTAVFAAAGVLIYAYLLIRARAAALDWGRPDTLAQLLQVVLRQQYADLEKARDIQTALNQAGRAAALIASEFTAAGIILCVAGIKGMLDTGRKERLVFFSTLTAVILAAIIFYFNLKEEMLWIMDVFMIPVYIAMAVFIGFGIKWIYNLSGGKLGTRNPELGTEDKTVKAKTQIPKYAALCLAAVLPVYMLAANYAKCDQNRYFYAYDFGMNIIKSMDPPAIAMLEGDFNVMPQMYFKYVEKKAGFCPVTTLFLYEQWGVLNLKSECPEVKFNPAPSDNYSGKLNNVITNNYKEKNIFASIVRNAFQEFYPRGNALLAPHGLLMKMTFDKKGSVKESGAILRRMSYRGILDEKLSQNSTTKLCLSNYASAFLETGNAFKEMGDMKKAYYYLTRAVTVANERIKAQAYTHLGVYYSVTGDYNSAIEVYKKAIAADKKMVEAYSNLAGIYNNLKRYDDAIELCGRAIKEKPDFSDVYNNLSIAYYSKGDKAKAIEAMEKAVSLNPGNERAKRNLMILKGEIK